MANDTELNSTEVNGPSTTTTTGLSVNVSSVAGSSDSVSPVWAQKEWLRITGLHTIETFYNPQVEPVLRGDASLAMLEAYIAEAILTGSAALNMRATMVASEWLRARAEGLLETDLQKFFEATLAATLGDEAVPAFAALVDEVGESSLSTQSVSTLRVMDAVAADLVGQTTLIVGIEETLEAEAGDFVQTLAHYLQNVRELAGAWLVFKTSGEVVQGWVMNVEGDRPFSEYANYDFNSMTRIGDSYFAASDAGLYKLGGGTDDGAQIDARLGSMMLDFGTTAQKRVVAAYLGYTSDGTVMLKVRSVDDGRLVEHWYKATEVTAEAPRENYRQLGRGLKSRYWQFEIANVDGADFEVDKLELQPILLSRRV